MRNLTKTLAVVSLLIPASAFPLGIGEIKLHSALNQNLDAEIALVLSSGENANDIKVSLASPDKFDENGIPWNYFLSKIKFQTIKSDDKRIIVKVTSREVLKEPFLDFLLQVTWPKGDLYREFTILVDPPSEYEQATASVSEAAVSYVEEPRSVKRVIQKPVKQRAKVSTISSTERYGPTVKNDTLWKIAERVGVGSGVSMEQLMMALYDANQSAFFKANINALMAGKTLKIPNKDDILKLPQSDALDEFNRQMRAWKSPASVPRMIAEPVRDESTTNNQLTLSAPVEDSVSEKASVDSISSNQTPNGAIVESSDKNASLSSNGAKNSDNVADDAIKSKIAALEKQLSTMQELIALKDQQLAALQNQTQSRPSVQPSTNTASVTDKDKIQAIVPPASFNQPVTQSPPVVAPTTTPNVPAVNTVLPKQQEIVVKPQITPPQSATPKPTIRKVSPTSVPEEDDSIWSYLGIGITGLFLLGSGWYWLKRRKSNHDDIFQPTGITSKLRAAQMSAESDAKQDDLSESVGDNLFVSDLSSGEFDVFDMDQTEIDPISEADVYLAYGRYQQAEDLMRHAIEEQPNRDDFKLKLLEIFYANENKQAFEKYTTDLIDEGKIDDITFWSKVTEMGAEICPDSLFFSAQPEPTEKKESFNRKEEIASEADEGKLDELDFDLASFEELFYSDDAENPTGGLFDLEITTKELPTIVSTEIKIQEEPEKNNDSLDFDLTDFAFNEPQTDIVKNEASNLSESKNDISIDAIDFSINSFEDVGIDIDEPSLLVSVDNSANRLEFDFTSIEDDLKVEEPPKVEAFKFEAIENFGQLEESIDFSLEHKPNEELFKEESLSINLDFTKPTLGFTEQQRIDSFGVANLADMDEMETKLDLAMAYIDMGDLDAAIEIAREILEKGTPEQQVIAKALLENHQ